MAIYAALEVSQAKTAICVVDGDGAVLKQGVTATCPDAITAWQGTNAADLKRLGMETGPLAVWLWNALTMRRLPVVCIDARHANAALKMMPNKTDRHDAIGLAQMMRRAGSKRSGSRATAPTSCARTSLRATRWSEPGSGSRTRSAAF